MFDLQWPLTLYDLYDCISGQAVNVGVTMYVLSISSLSEVEMVLLVILFYLVIFFGYLKKAKQSKIAQNG